MFTGLTAVTTGTGTPCCGKLLIKSGRVSALEIICVSEVGSLRAFAWASPSQCFQSLLQNAWIMCESVLRWIEVLGLFYKERQSILELWTSHQHLPGPRSCGRFPMWTLHGRNARDRLGQKQHGPSPGWMKRETQEPPSQLAFATKKDKKASGHSFRGSSGSTVVRLFD